MNLTTMTKKIQTINHDSNTSNEVKKCMIFLKNIRTENYDIVKGKKMKLSDAELNNMHEEIKDFYPKLWLRVKEATIDDGCKCKK